MAKAVAIIIALALLAFAVGAAIGASTADAKAPVAQTAVTGAWAQRASKIAVRNEECGKKSWFWVCTSVSNAVCNGGGRGTWHCYLAFTERYRFSPWTYNVCDSYVWIARSGYNSNPSRTNCKRA